MEKEVAENDADDAMECESSSYWNKEPETDSDSEIIDNPSLSTEIGRDKSNVTSGEQKDEDGSENELGMDIGNKDGVDDEEIEVTTGDNAGGTLKAVKIKPIDRNVVHQICSGQVIVTLSTAVKELVENAIDAGATGVEIRLVEYGSQVIEVIDNGSGVDESNLDGLALKHHTSKISEFEDLASVATFGFRGEALSSLCALGDLSVITRCKDSDSKMGFRIDYDSKGKIASKWPCAREFGTTVIIKNLFVPLPVRHREFIKNLKREFHKMVNTLYGYCLIAQGVRITCTNQIGGGASSKIISVPACPTLRERIAAIFGSKQLQSLMEIQQQEDISEETLAEFGLTVQTSKAANYTITGYVSVPNKGRSSNDRQFFFINSRPCDPSKISRVVNEAYHGFSRNQSPFVCLNIKTRRDTVDVNVTPDKRVLYLQSEKSLYALLKASLTSMYMSESSIFNLSAGQEILSFSQTQSDSQILIESQGNRSQSVESQDLKDDKSFASQFSTDKHGSRNSEESHPSSKSKARSFLQNFAYKTSGLRGRSQNTEKSSQENDRFSQPYSRSCSSKQPKLWDFTKKLSTNVVSKADGERSSEIQDEEERESRVNYNFLNYSPDTEDPCSIKLSQRSESQNSRLFSTQEIRDTEEGSEDLKIVYDDELEAGKCFSKPPSVNISFDWEEIKSKLKFKGGHGPPKDKNYAQKFRAKIAPGENDTAEQELKRQLTKGMFMEMKIIGQFNLGFVIVKYGPDVFIVDQHASDEKFNFEDLEKTTVMQTQKLISPMDLQLPAVSENVIIEYLDVFQKNGFEFDINENGEPTKRIRLTQIPYSRSCQFGKSDVDELIFMMEDAPEKCFCRPSKVRMMLASRACRKSVMIGTALSSTEMRNIVDHMGEMDQPWNCPHGRPTIRHLINLNLLPDIDLGVFNHA